MLSLPPNARCLVLTFFSFFQCLLTSASICPADQLLFNQKSPYNRVIVTQSPDGVRYLRFDSESNPVQSAYDTRHPDRLVAIYSRAVMGGLAIVPRPQKILVIGLGGGSISKFLHQHFPEALVQSVELDPVVIEAAKRFFDFREDEHNKAFAGDGRAFLEKSKDRYDLIMLDAFGPDSAPHALITREFLKLAREHLSDGGLVVANIQGPAVNKLYSSMLLTYQDVFAELHIIKAPGHENRIFLASPRKLGLFKDRLITLAAQVQAREHFDFDLPYIIQTGYEPARPAAGAKVLLDADVPH